MTTELHVPRIVAIVAALAILSYANAETKGLVVALVVVALVSLVLTSPAGIASLTSTSTGGLRRIFTPPSPADRLPGHQSGPPIAGS